MMPCSDVGKIDRNVYMGACFSLDAFELNSCLSVMGWYSGKIEQLKINKNYQDHEKNVEFNLHSYSIHGYACTCTTAQPLRI